MVDSFKTGNADFADEAELRRVLREACDAPQVPESLLQRIDRNVEAVWGESPQLHRSQMGPARRIVRDGIDRLSTRRARAYSLTTVATVVTVVTFLFVTRDRYSWAEMIDRLQQEPVVKITEQELSKVFFFSASDEVVAERTGSRTHVVDFRRKVEFDYRSGDEVVLQKPLDVTDAQPDAGLSWLLLNGGRLPTESIPTVVVESESWSRVSQEGRQLIELRTQLSFGLESIQVVALVDPDTHFPSAVEVQAADAGTRRLSFARVDTGDTVLAVAGLPTGLPIVESRGTVDATGMHRASSSDSSLAINTDSTQISRSRNATSRNSAESNPSQSETEVVTGSIRLSWSPVSPVSMSASVAAQEVDRLLLQAWRGVGLTPVDVADKSVLMRRLYLDLTGRIPTVSEVRDFEETVGQPGAVDTLIAQLLESADHASHVAAVWRSFLLPEEAEFDESVDTASFEAWFAEQLVGHVPYDQTVRSLLLAEGRLAEAGPLIFYSAAKLEPEKLAARSARAFLGMRLECAQCHDDPFEPWTQNDFWSFAAYFARISRPNGKLDAASPVMLVRDVDWGDVTVPESETVVAPRLLDGTVGEDGAGEQSRRQQLAEWLTAKENPFFARATVNRVWSLMFGRGIVDPVDGFGAVNQADVPDVLDLLAGYFVASGFDLRELYRAIASTKAYRLSSGGGIDDGSERQRWFAQMHVKVLSAGQLYDSVAVATLLESSFGADSGRLSLERVGNSSRQQFVDQFESPAAEASNYQGGIPLALTLMNGQLIQRATGIQDSGLLNALRAPFFSSNQRIRTLFLATVAREPTTVEWDLCRAHLDRVSDEIEGVADILWALLNSAEFAVNH